MIRHTIADIEEFIRFDRDNPEQATNLSATYGPIKKAQFAGSNGNILYVLVNSELHRIQVGSDDNDLLVTGAAFFTVYRGDRLAFIADRNQVREVGIYRDDRETVMADAPAGTPLNIALSGYFNHDYLAVSQGNKVDIYKDPSEVSSTASKPFESFTIDQSSVDWLYFSNNGRFIVAQQQANFTSYDLELVELHKRSFGSAQPVTRPFKWLDDYYLWIDLDNNLRIVEFDGANERAISSVVTGQSVSLSDNGDVLFSIGHNSGNNKFELQSSQLVLK